MGLSIGLQGAERQKEGGGAGNMERKGLRGVSLVRF